MGGGGFGGDGGGFRSRGGGGAAFLRGGQPDDDEFEDDDSDMGPAASSYTTRPMNTWRPKTTSGARDTSAMDTGGGTDEEFETDF